MTASAYPQYNPNSHCAKCGCTDATTKYVRTTFLFGGSLVLPAHMERTCRRCGYEWTEAPLG